MTNGDFSSPRPKPPLVKNILAWCSIGFGALTAIGAIFSGSIGGFFGVLLIGAAFALPGVWWKLHQRREAAGQQPLPRKWPTVGIAAVVMFVIGVFMLPTPDTKPVDTEVSTSTSSATKTSTSTSTTSKSSTTPPSSTTESTPPAQPTETSTPTPEPLPEPDQQPHGLLAPEPTTTATPAPAPEREAYVPPAQPAPVQPAPAAPAQDVYFANCSEARAAGVAPIYQGSPGYRPALDRNNDGVACEKS